MKKVLDKLKSKIRINKKMATFLIGITIIAIVTGSIYATFLNNSDKLLVKNQIDTFINNIKDNNINYFSTFINAFLSNGIFVLFIWLLGLSIVGMPIIIIMYFLKVFILSFSVASIIVNYKLKGILLSFIYIFPHFIINIFAYMLLIIYAITLSLKIGHAIIKRVNVDFKPIMNKYIYILVFTIISCLLTALIEVFITPNLIKLIIPLIK